MPPPGSDAVMAASGVVTAPDVPARLPSWIRIRPPHGERYAGVRAAVAELGIGTVCQEARCPNLSECWSAGTATIMLLGTECTRRCSFCAVTTRWPQGQVDATEPDRVAEAVARWGLSYVVLTQVCRDDLPDGGAAMMARTVAAIRRRAPAARIELLVGDLGGSDAALRTVLKSRPDVLAHNLETVERLSPEVRDRRASYRRSLELLERAAGAGELRPVTKSSIMLGLGESPGELEATFSDLRGAGVDLLTLGQYLRPSAAHRAVARYVTPEEFDALRAMAIERGFSGAEGGPLVRSSYHARELFEAARRRRPG